MGMTRTQRAALAIVMPAFAGLQACASPYDGSGGGAVSTYRSATASGGIAETDERYGGFWSNQIVITEQHPVSTVAMDVDTAAYAVLRRYLSEKAIPPHAALRTEELINYFPYDYPAPKSLDERLTVSSAIFPTPWNPDTELLHIGIKAFNIPLDQRPPANIVFVIDTSGSLEEPQELPLIKRTLSEAVALLRPQDRLAIVSYSGSVSVDLPPTPADQTEAIAAAVESLSPGGHSKGGPALRTAYEQAEAMIDRDASNRIILISDGDFNVWDSETTDREELLRFVRAKSDSDISLSVIGVGRGDLDDLMMQQLATAGNGMAAYVDRPLEARKLLIEDFGSNLFPIANDARMMVEFNPDRVAEYRLIGYETREQSEGDFNDPNANGGEIGSGHAVTFLYEIVPPDSPARRIVPLRYQPEEEAEPDEFDDEYALVRIHYKRPGERRIQRFETVIDRGDRATSLAQATPDQRFAAAVAAFSEKLRRDGFVGREFPFDEVRALAANALGPDPEGYRRGFLDMVDRAKAIECELSKARIRECDGLKTRRGRASDDLMGGGGRIAPPPPLFLEPRIASSTNPPLPPYYGHIY